MTTPSSRESSPDPELESRAGGTPVCHPDRRNWRPGDDDADELLTQKVADAIRDGASERQMAKLLGWSRAHMWRAKQVSQIPEELFDRLRAAGVGNREIVAVGRALKDGEIFRRDVECCPNCGHAVRVRPAIKPSTRKIVADWLDEIAERTTDGAATVRRQRGPPISAVT
jgi:hypothetical protein